ncbi:MAG TPA: hypothetical protein VGM07_15260 [Stellaceae bacterium]|jgi:hypothetical protein
MIDTAAARARDKSSDCYAFLERQSYEITRSLVGFTALITPMPDTLSAAQWENLAARYDTIKEWQATTLELFAASLAGQADPVIAELFLSEIPPYLVETHRSVVLSLPVETPVFFRTDEAMLGKIVEVQSPGSLWGTYEQLQDYYQAHGFTLGPELSERWTHVLTAKLGKPPVIHHLFNIFWASESYFAQKARRFVRYYAYDKGVRPLDCNFVRAHHYLVLVDESLFTRRREAWSAGCLHYDVPPISIYQQKLQMCLPFWPVTRHFYSDAVRELFPYTCLVTPQGMVLEDGEEISISQFCALPRRRREYFLKYGGPDMSKNWGAMAVYNLAKLSQRACLDLLERVIGGPGYWVMQRACTQTCEVDYVQRDLSVARLRGHPKYSCFYGPGGLLGVLNMYETFYKVHGSAETVMTIATPSGVRSNHAGAAAGNGFAATPRDVVTH